MHAVQDSLLLWSKLSAFFILMLLRHHMQHKHYSSTSLENFTCIYVQYYVVSLKCFWTVYIYKTDNTCFN